MLFFHDNARFIEKNKKQNNNDNKNICYTKLESAPRCNRLKSVWKWTEIFHFMFYVYLINSNRT